MALNEVLLLVREAPATIVAALDTLMAARGYLRAAARDLHHDFTPLLVPGEDGVAFVLSQPRSDWVACFSSLNVDTLWDLAEPLARALQQPTWFLLFAASQATVAYRFFQDGVLREELLPEEPAAEQGRLDEPALLALLHERGVPLALVRDRLDHFGEEHLALAYVQSLS